MNQTEFLLKGELVKRGLSIPKICDLTGISRKRMYSHLKANTFTQHEIGLISDAAGFTNEDMLCIFFGRKVS